MTKTELLTRFAPDDQSRIALARLLDKAELTHTRDVPSHTPFLSSAEQALAQNLLAAAGHPRCLFYGGYPEPSRAVCLFLPSWQEDFTPGGEDDPLAALELPLPPGSSLTHRDFLGAMMGLGITRELVGDILVGEDACQVVCLRSALPILLSQWSEVGRYPVRPRELPLSQLRPVEARVEERHETFQSLRFDAVAAAAFRIPRSRAALLISGGHLLLNHLPCAKPDRLLREGDVLTGKGLGKCVLAQVAGQSRKGRTVVTLRRYL